MSVAWLILSSNQATYFTQESEQFETAVIDLELRRARKATHAIREVVEEIEEILRHFVAMEWAIDSQLSRGVVTSG